MSIKRLSLMVAIVFVFSLLSTSSMYAATFEEVTEEAVEICEAIGMLQGTGSGVTEDYLASTPQRYQGAILLLRLMGLYEDALTYGGDGSYADTETFNWVEGRKILHYLYDNQLSIGFKGYPDNTFRPYGEMNAKQYYKVMLVALGYEENVDFAWDPTDTLPGTLEMCQSLGMTWLLTDAHFTISDLAIATMEALVTPVKGSTETLAEELVDQGVIDASAAAASGLIVGTEPPVDPTVTDATAAADMVYPYEIAVDITEAELIIAVSNVTFKSSVGQDSSETALLLDNIVGDQDYAGGWNDNMRPLLSHGWVTREDATTVVVNMNNISDYEITADETLTVTLPPELFNEPIDTALDAGEVIIYDSGSGTFTDPYQLLRPQDFMFVARNSDMHFDIAADMDFTDVYLVETTDFTGVLDGKNHTLSNLSITAGHDNTGLVSMATGATIRDIQFEDCSLNGQFKGKVGFVTGYAVDSDISGIFMSGCSLTDAKMAGLLVGSMEGNSSLSGSVIENSSILNNPAYDNVNWVGGAVGITDPGNGNELLVSEVVLNEVAITAQNASSVGGIIGTSQNKVTVDSCSYNGDLSGETFVGGIMGSSSSQISSAPTVITNCQGKGTIEAETTLGGILGMAGGYYHLEDNYGGQTTVTSTYSSSMLTPISSLYVHRILGKDNGTVVAMDNTAYASMEFYTSSGAEVSSVFVSDAAGLDGEDFFMTFFWFEGLELYEREEPEEDIWDRIEDLLDPPGTKTDDLLDLMERF